MDQTHHSHYPDFHVLNEQDAWDPHTRDIVRKRLNRSPLKELTGEEPRTLRALFRQFVNDDREEILDFLVFHIDQKLSSNIGESQRKAGVPKFSVLLSDGLAALNHISQSLYGSGFADIEPRDQSELVKRLMEGHVIQVDVQGTRPTKEFLHRILTEAVSAYYSHPDIWSEIGYAGPAYPRGYVRTERGLTDPWEAKSTDAE